MPASPLPDYYEILGVAAAAPADDIKRAYRRQSAVSHPDKGGSTGTFRLVQMAYETLSNPDRRALYDRERVTPEVADAPDPAAASTAEPGQPEPQQSHSSRDAPSSPPPADDNGPRTAPAGSPASAVPVKPGYRRGLIPLLVCAAFDIAVVLVAAIFLWPDPPVSRLFLWLAAVAAPVCVWVSGRPDVVALRWPPVAAFGALVGGFALAGWRTRTDPDMPGLIAAGAGHLALTLVALICWRTWQRTRRLNSIVPRDQLRGSLVFGAPGAGLSAAAAVPVREVADRLFRLACARPAVSVVHLAGLPAGAVLTAADHAVLAGRRVAVVVTYPLPAAAAYSFDGYGNLLADGHHFPNDAAAFRQAVTDLQARLPKRFAARGWIIAHGRPATVSTKPSEGLVHVGSLDEVVPAVAAWLSDQQPVVHREALAVLAQHAGA